LGCKDSINYKKYYSNGQINAKRFENDIKTMMQGEPIDLYYENVGEDMLSSMLKLMADHSKIIMCGATATYNNWNKKSGVLNMENIISKRIEMKGILYFSLDLKDRI
jgi:NADPH-dependent curcumin reductase CurA